MTMSNAYQDYLSQSLNTVERWTGVLGLDERLDYTNILLTNILLLLGGEIPNSESPAATVGLKQSIDALVVALGRNRSDFSTGQKTVTTAGTPEQLPSVRIPDGHTLTLVAKTENAGDIYPAPSDAEAGPNSTARLDALKPGDRLEVRLDNLNRMWVDAETSGDGVSWYVEI